MNRSKQHAYRLVCALTASSLMLSVGSCSREKDPTPPVVDPECVTPPANGNFVDSTQARVVIRNFEFVPASITVRAGQTVKWKHCGPELDQHTVTSDAGSPQTLDSPFLGPGAIYTRVFTVAEANPYHCTPHPDMRGTVTVVP